MYHHIFGSTCTVNGCFSYHVISMMPSEFPGMTYPSPSMTLSSQWGHQMTCSFFPRFWRQRLVLAPFSSCPINCKPLSASCLFFILFIWDNSMLLWRKLSGKDFQVCTQTNLCQATAAPEGPEGKGSPLSQHDFSVTSRQNRSWRPMLINPLFRIS